MAVPRLQPFAGQARHQAQPWHPFDASRNRAITLWQESINFLNGEDTAAIPA
jgi:hypothetical protein